VSRGLQVGPRQQEGELLAALTADNTAVVRQRLHRSPRELQHLIAALVPMRVVEQLESIQIRKDQRKLRKLIVECPLVHEPCQSVRCGLSAERDDVLLKHGDLPTRYLKRLLDLRVAKQGAAAFLQQKTRKRLDIQARLSPASLRSAICNEAPKSLTSPLISPRPWRRVSRQLVTSRCNGSPAAAADALNRA